jgi:hypothetical protein
MLAFKGCQIINAARGCEFLRVDTYEMAQSFVSSRLVQKFDDLLFRSFIQRNSHEGILM